MKLYSMYINRKNKIVQNFTLFFILSILAYFFTFSKANFEIMTNTITVFIKIVMPSLFPFILFSNIIIFSGYFSLIANSKINTLIKYLFNVSKYTASCIIFGFLFGYPNGARFVNELYEKKKISYNEAEYLLFFINNSSPIFILSSIGIGMFSNIKIGILLLVSHVLSSIILGKLYRHKYIFNQNSKLNYIEDINISVNFEVITKSILKTFYTLGIILGFMIISILTHSYITKGLFYFLKLSKLNNIIILNLLEVTSGLNVFTASNLDLKALLILTSFFLGFSSLSIIFQIYSCVYLNKFKLYNIIKGKIFHGILSSLITYILLSIFQIYNYINITKKVNLNLYPSVSPNVLNTMILTHIAIFILYFLLSFIIFKKKRLC